MAPTPGGRAITKGTLSTAETFWLQEAHSYSVRLLKECDIMHHSHMAGRCCVLQRCKIFLFLAHAKKTHQCYCEGRDQEFVQC